jgi:hypothetical protein
VTLFPQRGLDMILDAILAARGGEAPFEVVAADFARVATHAEWMREAELGLADRVREAVRVERERGRSG